jgi:hypothetical protein
MIHFASICLIFFPLLFYVFHFFIPYILHLSPHYLSPLTTHLYHYNIYCRNPLVLITSQMNFIKYPNPTQKSVFQILAILNQNFKISKFQNLSKKTKTSNPCIDSLNGDKSGQISLLMMYNNPINIFPHYNPDVIVIMTQYY